MKLVFAEQAWDDYLRWHATDPKLTKRIHLLIKEASCTPFDGIGKPEPLRHSLSGYWSRRINDEHRMVYKVDGDCLLIAQLRYHY
jgi:toxin YoeB